MGEKKQFAVGALLSYCSIALGILAGLLYTPWVIRTVGDHGYGLYTLALSVVNFFLLDFGIGAAVTRFLSGFYARGEREEASRFLGLVYKVLGMIAVVIALCLAAVSLLAGRIYPLLGNSDLSLLRGLVAVLGVYSAAAFPFAPFNGILTANERFVELKACDLGHKLLCIGLAVFALKLGWGVYALAVCHVFGGGVCLLLKYWLVRRNTGQRAALQGWDRPAAKSLWAYSRWVAVMNLAHRCIFNIMPTVIAGLVGSEAVTLFALAATLEGYLFTVGEAVNGMFLPKMSRLTAREEDVSALVTRVGKFQICVIGLVFIGFACLGRAFVELWMGAGYEQVRWCALLLMVPGLISIPQQGARTALLAKGCVKEQALAYAVMAVLNILLAVVLVPPLGVLGGGISVCIAYLVRTAGMNLLYRRQLSLNLGAWFRKVYGRWLPGAVVTLGVGLAVSRFLPLPGWGGLAAKAFLICAVYGALLLCFDRAWVKEILKHRG